MIIHDVIEMGDKPDGSFYVKTVTGRTILFPPGELDISVELEHPEDNTTYKVTISIYI